MLKIKNKKTMKKVETMRQRVSDNCKKIQEIISSEMPLRERTRKRRKLEKRNKELLLNILELQQ